MDAPNLDLELTRLIERGERRRAATILVERFASDVYALCRAMVRDATLAEDLAQDVFGRAISALDSFRGEASPRTWLLKIARNRCLDHLAHAKRSPIDAYVEHDVDAHVEDAPETIDLLVRREDAQRALESLAESERAIIVLHFGHGVGYAELADAFGMKEGAVRMRVSRAVARMRESLECEAAAPKSYGAPSAAPAAARKSAGGILGGLGRLLRGERPLEARDAESPEEQELREATVRPPAPIAARPPAASAAPPVPSRAAPPAPASPPARSRAAPTPASPTARSRAAPTPAYAPHPLHDHAPAPLLGRLRALLDAL